MQAKSTPPSKRCNIRQAAERADYSKEAIYRTIDAATVATVAVSIEGEPLAIPMVIGRIGDKVYLHGSRASRLMRHLAAGHPVCISIAHLDGLVVSRSGMHCSANYRYVVIHGCGELVAEDEKPALLHELVEAVIPGSRGDFRDHTEKEVYMTTLIAVPLEESACKMREGGPKDDEEDLNLPFWAGVIPVTQVYGEPIPAANLPAGVETPEYARNFTK